MRKFRIIAAFIILPLLLSLVAFGAASQSRKKRRGHVEKTEAVKKMETVSTGNWGGPHIRMDVTGEGAFIDFDCAHAMINQPLALNASGGFTAQGRYVREHGGAMRSDENQDGQPAHFTGRVAGKTLTLTITIDGSSEDIGTYTLELGKPTRIVKCM
jgi:hypothetical protein